MELVRKNTAHREVFMASPFNPVDVKKKHIKKICSSPSYLIKS